jgi:hypothetical protein
MSFGAAHKKHSHHGRHHHHHGPHVGAGKSKR